MKNKIENIDDLVKKGLTIKKSYGEYSVIKTSKKAFFENDYSDKRLIDYRSVVVDDNDSIKSIGFFKLFNYEELDFNQRQQYLETDVIAVEKVNGFMFCISVFTEDNKRKIIYHTKGSLENEFIDWAKEYISEDKISLLDSGFTYIFEICHPKDPHIITEDFGAYLIGQRSHFIDSQIIEENVLDTVAFYCDFKRPKWFKDTLKNILEKIKTLKTEGYIIRENTNIEKPLFKLKSPYYRYLKIIARGKSNNAINRALEVSKENSVLERLHQFVSFSHPLIFQMDEQERLRVLKETYHSLEIAENSKNNKTLFILRGLPGSGKSTLAKHLLNLPNSKMFEADDFFLDSEGVYNFNKDLLHQAHKECQKGVLKAFTDGIDTIIVSNTNTTEKEISVYINMAKVYNYKIQSLIIENRHNGESIHNVPEETLDKMKTRFSIKL